MNFPVELSNKGISILKQLEFLLTESFDQGMWKYYKWENSEFNLNLTYDRGYYDCDICLIKHEPIIRLQLIPLLKFLKRDKKYGNKELKEANLFRTLTPDGYLDLLNENYDLIKLFNNEYNRNQFEGYKNFEFDYEEI